MMGLCREWKELVDQWVNTTKEITGNCILSFTQFQSFTSYKFRVLQLNFLN